MAAPDLTLAAFTFFNTLRLASYLPQLWRIAQDTNGATAISYASWIIWIGANASTGAYAWVNLGDRWLAFISTFNAACCLAVCMLTAWKRRQWRRANDTRAGRPVVSPGPSVLPARVR
jgi:hypothetical protein